MFGWLGPRGSFPKTNELAGSAWLLRVLGLRRQQVIGLVQVGLLQRGGRQLRIAFQVPEGKGGPKTRSFEALTN